MADTQRVINLATSQIAHGVVSKPTGTDAEVVVGYEPSMIRVTILNNTTVVHRLYWYATDPNKAIKMVDSESNGCEEIDAPLVVNEHGFVLTFASSGQTKAIWETYGAEPGTAVPYVAPTAQSMPDVVEDEEGEGSDGGS